MKITRKGTSCTQTKEYQNTIVFTEAATPTNQIGNGDADNSSNTDSGI